MPTKKVSKKHALLHLIDRVKQKVTDQEYKDIVEELAKEPTGEKYVEVEYVHITPTEAHPTSDLDYKLVQYRQKRVYRVVKDYTCPCDCCNFGDKQTEITETFLSVLEDVIPASNCFIRERYIEGEVSEMCIYLSVKRLS